jgi:hypothetical protein
MVASFFDQLLPVLAVEGSILVELFTDGGDAEIGRRLAEEVRLLRVQLRRDVWFLGKTPVASAGITVMAAFPKDKRWLTRDAALLIHGRRMVKDLHLEGPLGSCRRVLEEMMPTSIMTCASKNKASQNSSATQTWTQGRLLAAPIAAGTSLQRRL